MAGCLIRPLSTDCQRAKRNRKPQLKKLRNSSPRQGRKCQVITISVHLGRSVSGLIKTITALKEKGVGFKSLRDGAIDTTTPSGELIFHIFAALAQFERELIRERTRAGMKAAKARGINGGRKRVTVKSAVVQTAKRMHAAGGMSNEDICASLKISNSTLYRYLAMEVSDDEQ